MLILSFLPIMSENEFLIPMALSVTGQLICYVEKKKKVTFRVVYMIGMK